MASYTVRPGESWASIAGTVFGDQRWFEELERANPGVDLLHPGMTINLPDVSGEPVITVAPSAQGYNPFSTGVAPGGRRAGRDTGRGGAPLPLSLTQPQEFGPETQQALPTVPLPASLTRPRRVGPRGSGTQATVNRTLPYLSGQGLGSVPSLASLASLAPVAGSVGRSIARGLGAIGRGLAAPFAGRGPVLGGLPGQTLAGITPPNIGRAFQFGGPVDLTRSQALTPGQNAQANRYAALAASGLYTPGPQSSSVRPNAPREPTVRKTEGFSQQIVGMNKRGDVMTQAELANAARYTGLAVYEFGKTGNRNQLPNRISTRLASELPFRGAGFETVEDFLRALGYADNGDGTWNRLDPVRARGRRVSGFSGGGTTRGPGRGGGGGGGGGGRGGFESGPSGGPLVMWRVGL